MRKQMEVDLPAKLAVKLQSGMHYYLLAFQKNTRIKDSNVHLNKNIVDFCMTKQHFMLMIRGNFYI